MRPKINLEVTKQQLMMLKRLLTYRSTDLFVIMTITFEGGFELGLQIGPVIELMTEAEGNMVTPKYRS